MSTTDFIVSDVLIACDTVESGYRIVALDNSQFAFVWGNIPCREGDALPFEYIASPTSEKGVEIWNTYADARFSYRLVAMALRRTTSKAGDEMLSRIV